MKSYDPRRDIVRPEPSNVSRELSTREGAVAHARQLTEWWHARGHTTVKFEVAKQHANHGGHDPAWTVTSNLHNGLPPKAPVAAAPPRAATAAPTLAAVPTNAAASVPPATAGETRNHVPAVASL